MTVASTQRAALAYIGSAVAPTMHGGADEFQALSTRAAELRELIQEKLDQLTAEGGWTGAGARAFREMVVHDLIKPLGEFSEQSAALGQALRPLAQSVDSSQQVASSNPIPWDIAAPWTARPSPAAMANPLTAAMAPIEVVNIGQIPQRIVPQPVWMGIEGAAAASVPPPVYTQTGQPTGFAAHNWDVKMETLGVNPTQKVACNGAVASVDASLNAFLPEGSSGKGKDVELKGESEQEQKNWQEDLRALQERVRQVKDVVDQVMPRGNLGLETNTPLVQPDMPRTSDIPQPNLAQPGLDRVTPGGHDTPRLESGTVTQGVHASGIDPTLLNGSSNSLNPSLASGINGTQLGAAISDGTLAAGVDPIGAPIGTTGAAASPAAGTPLVGAGAGGMMGAGGLGGGAAGSKGNPSFQLDGRGRGIINPGYDGGANSGAGAGPGGMMPMGMGAGNRRGAKDEDRDHEFEETWLEEDQDVWGEEDAPPGLITK